MRGRREPAAATRCAPPAGRTADGTSAPGPRRAAADGTGWLAAAVRRRRPGSWSPPPSRCGAASLADARARPPPAPRPGRAPGRAARRIRSSVALKNIPDPGFSDDDGSADPALAAALAAWQRDTGAEPSGAGRPARRPAAGARGGGARRGRDRPGRAAPREDQRHGGAHPARPRTAGARCPPSPPPRRWPAGAPTPGRWPSRCGRRCRRRAQEKADTLWSWTWRGR